ncbi:MAG: hypothetical protein MN733_28360, partial [Nitrososphaera sp.]|nr:hypothetical protein [Nitrososphaera sp.]
MRIVKRYAHIKGKGFQPRLRILFPVVGGNPACSNALAPSDGARIRAILRTRSTRHSITQRDTLGCMDRRDFHYALPPERIARYPAA